MRRDQGRARKGNNQTDPPLGSPPPGIRIQPLGMLKVVRMTVPPLSFSGRNFFMQSSFSRTKMSLAIASALCLAASPMLLTGCKRASAGTTIPTASPQAVELRAPAVGPHPPALQEPLHGHSQPLRLGESISDGRAEHGHAACDPGRRQPQPVGCGRNAAPGLRAPPGPHRARQRPARCPRRRSREPGPMAAWLPSKRRTTPQPPPVPRFAATSKPPSKPSATWAWWSTSGPNPACADHRPRRFPQRQPAHAFTIPFSLMQLDTGSVQRTRSRADASNKVDPHLRDKLEG